MPELHIRRPPRHVEPPNYVARVGMLTLISLLIAGVLAIFS